MERVLDAATRKLFIIVHSIFPFHTFLFYYVVYDSLPVYLVSQCVDHKKCLLIDAMNLLGSVSSFVLDEYTKSMWRPPRLLLF